MFLSEPNKLLFIHIPKTGGTSITNALIEGFGDFYIKGTNTRHRKLCLLDKRNLIGYFKFTFVRNPYDRILSYYSWVMHGYKRRQKMILYSSFKEFILHLEDYIKEKNTYRIDPQVSFIQSNKYKMNYVGKMENMQKDFNIVMDLINHPHIQIGKDNESKHRNYRRCYDAITKKIVTNFYQEDLDTFKYTF